MAEERESSRVSQNRLKRSPRSVNSETKESILSPRFRSAAAMAGWDEEALLLATLVVEDTPVRESMHRKRRIQQLKSPPSTSSNRRRRSRQRPADLIPAVILCLDDDVEVSSHQEVELKEKESEGSARNNEKQGDTVEGDSAEIACGKGLPCMDRLREELSCAICLEICYEPSTTPCGHSFCKKCLKRSADKCGKRCPKCRQLISNGRSCTVNTVLWNTIQLLFPEEVEARKKAVAVSTSSRKEVSSNGLEMERNPRDTRARNRHSSRNSSTSFRSANEVLGAAEGDGSARRRRRPIQSQDAALALRLQREEFLEAFMNSSGQQRNSLYTTRERLRAIAIRMRNRSSHA